MLKPEIVYEDNHIIVVLKPSGVLSQGDISGSTSMLEIVREYIRVEYSKPGNVFTGLVHRLDRPVSGLMVFAKTSKAARRLHTEFSERKVDKYYTAVTEGVFDTEGKWLKLEHSLIRIKDRTHLSAPGKKGAVKAIMNCITLHTGNDRSLVLIKLETGRKHQIRSQLSAAGCPVLGDSRYGSQTDKGSAICLHACRLGFTHPTTRERMEFSSSIPGHFKREIPLNEQIYQSMITEAIRSI